MDHAMKPALMALLFIAAPSFLFWAVLGLTPRIGRWWRIVIGALGGGAAFSAALMWEDAADGFCCREYPATVWTELSLYVPLGLFAVAGSIVLLAADQIRSCWRK